MFNKQREVNKMAKAYALVTGDKVDVLPGATIREVVGVQKERNRFAPLVRAKVYEVRYDVAKNGSVENVKLGKYVF